jgi:glycerol-3-phosphate dehydrogenase subunit B
VVFPKRTGVLYPVHLARSLELPEARAQLAEAIRPHINRAGYVGLPAILGIHETKKIFDDLQEQLKRPLFEIPTMPPSITGLRLRNIFVRQLPLSGVRTFFHHKVLKASYIAKKGFRFEVGPQETIFVVQAKGAVLASGRFFGRGLCADRKRITETVFGLPVYQPPDRAHWHRKSFLDRKGHPINLSGLETDDRFRPLGANGRPAFPNLFAAGSILAHQDWKRMKCGSGLAITTAYGAVKAFERQSR